jgi:hypothetical protein
MPKKKEQQIYLDFEILDWWIDWWRNEKDHYFCAIVRINDQKYYIERELNQT